MGFKCPICYKDYEYDKQALIQHLQKGHLTDQFADEALGWYRWHTEYLKNTEKPLDKAREAV